jgi:hypothetical protein
VTGQSASKADVPPRSEYVADVDLVPQYRGSALPFPPPLSESKIRRSEHGETLAVLALLLPLVAQCLILACRFDSPGIDWALSWGAVAVTALLLAVDAALLGTTDLHGVQRRSPTALFLACFSSGSSVTR